MGLEVCLASGKGGAARDIVCLQAFEGSTSNHNKS